MESKLANFKPRVNGERSTSTKPRARRRTSVTNSTKADSKPDTTESTRISSGQFPNDLCERIRTLRARRFIASKEQESIDAVVIAVVRAGLDALEASLDEIEA